MNLRNYEDSRCTWGYITLCDDCASMARRGTWPPTRHINANKAIIGKPIAECCEWCKKKVDSKEG